jgi:hypothetical protein
MKIPSAVLDFFHSDRRTVVKRTDASKRTTNCRVAAGCDLQIVLGTKRRVLTMRVTADSSWVHMAGGRN